MLQRHGTLSHLPLEVSTKSITSRKCWNITFSIKWSHERESIYLFLVFCLWLCNALIFSFSCVRFLTDLSSTFGLRFLSSAGVTVEACSVGWQKLNISSFSASYPCFSQSVVRRHRCINRPRYACVGYGMVWRECLFNRRCDFPLVSGGDPSAHSHVRARLIKMTQ